MKMARTLVLILLVMGLNTAWAGTSTDHADKGLSGMLPVMKGLEADGKPRTAQTPESLFGCINGGAEVFISAGFKQAVFQSYTNEQGRRLNLEIYEMATKDGSKAIFSKNTLPEDKRVAIGDEAVTGNYYILFRKSNFYVAMTGFDPGQETLDLLGRVARKVDNAIASGK